jgi:hypothetical protein
VTDVNAMLIRKNATIHKSNTYTKVSQAKTRIIQQLSDTLVIKQTSFVVYDCMDTKVIRKQLDIIILTVLYVDNIIKTSVLLVTY